MRAVVDTNVLVSGVANPNREPELVIEAAACGDIALVRIVPTESPGMQWLPEDPADNWVIQCAITGAADYIVTDDRVFHFFWGIDGGSCSGTPLCANRGEAAV